MRKNLIERGGGGGVDGFDGTEEGEIEWGDEFDGTVGG